MLNILLSFPSRIFTTKIVTVCLCFSQNSVEDLPESESPSDKKRRLTNDTTEGERSSSSIDILDLKSKLEKMGTNVSLAPGGSGASSQMRSPRMSALVDPAATAASPPCASPTAAAAGISVIRNGESFNLANIAEVKLNFDESLRTLSPGRLATHNKPSCAVRPMMKPVTVKPLATVRPLMQNESQLSAASDADKGAEQLGLPAVNGLTRIPEELPGHASSSSSSSAAAVRSQNAAIGGSPLPVKPLAAVPVSGEGASAALPPVAHVAAVQKSVESDVSRGSPPALPDASSTSAGSSAAAASSSAAGGRAAAAESSAGESSVSPVIKTEAGDGVVSSQHQNGNHHHGLSPGLGGGTAASGLVPAADTEDVFNADIVCPHGNLRIGDRCKQLISREAWFRLRNYFDSPKTFQFGIDIASCFFCPLV
jgi:hypothetical protein